VPDWNTQQYVPLLTHGGQNVFSRLAQTAAALFLLTIGLAAPARAQNNLQIISGAWYEDRANFSNTNSSTFTLSFAQTPANQFLNVTNVSCVGELNLRVGKSWQAI
jgi:hypothetical protein